MKIEIDTIIDTVQNLKPGDILDVKMQRHSKLGLWVQRLVSWITGKHTADTQAVKVAKTICRIKPYLTNIQWLRTHGTFFLSPFNKGLTHLKHRFEKSSSTQEAAHLLQDLLLLSEFINNK